MHKGCCFSYDDGVSLDPIRELAARRNDDDVGERRDGAAIWRQARGVAVVPFVRPGASLDEKARARSAVPGCLPSEMSSLRAAGTFLSIISAFPIHISGFRSTTSSTFHLLVASSPSCPLPCSEPAVRESAGRTLGWARRAVPAACSGRPSCPAAFYMNRSSPYYAEASRNAARRTAPRSACSVPGERKEARNGRCVYWWRVLLLSL